MPTRQKLRLRKATPADCRDVWVWRNDRQTRSNSLKTARIRWRDHCRWFQKKLADPKRRMFMAVNRGHKIGVIRFDIVENGTAEISLNMNPKFRGRGFGGRILKRGSRLIKRKHPGKIQKAVIKDSNPVSEKIFSLAGFKKIHEADKSGFSIWIRP